MDVKVDFFISRAGADKKWAQWIADCLVGAGYSVRLQDWDFRPGQDFVTEMDRAMRDAERTIAVLSRSYDKAFFTVPEWTNAIARDPTGQKALLVPIKIDDIVPEGIFRTRIYIDLVSLEEDEARKVLLDGIQRASARSVAPTPFPGGVTARFPGALPPVWRTSSNRNPVFTGRESELAAITARFESNDPPPLAVALVGLGGVGKSALAVEYANRYRQLYKVVWWIRAQHHETVIADLALLAEKLELASSEMSLSTLASKAREWLEAHDQWLLMVDDAEDLAVARSAIPQGGGGHVLFMSRSPAWRRHAAVIELASLPEASATDLLVKRSGQIADSASIRLVKVLGCLPLAVELAGAFLEQQGIGAAEYLARLRRQGGIPTDDGAYRPPDYDASLRSVWAESFRVLMNQTPRATDLLRLAAFLAPDDIPRPALVRGAHRLPPVLGEVAADPDALADLVAQPRKLSLVTTSEDGFSMHRLVQAILRDGLEKDCQMQWARSAVLLMDHVLPRQVADFRLWDRTGRLISHALAAAEHGVNLSAEPAATVRLLDRGATYLVETGGQPDEIAARRGEALSLGETLPEGPPGWLLNNHAQWLLEQNAAEQAEGMFERAVETTRRTEGGDSPALGATWINLGAVVHQKSDLVRARICFERGLAILDRCPSWADGKRATGHSLLGQVLFKQGNRDAAAAHFAVAVRGYDAALGPGSPDAILARSLLAQARGKGAVVSYVVTPTSIKAEEGRLLAAEKAWTDEAEQLLRSAWQAGEPGAAVELAWLLRKQPDRKVEGDNILAQAAQKGDQEALYWHARELAGQEGLAAEEAIKSSIEAGNVFSWFDLGLVLADHQQRWPEAEVAFQKALAAGFEEARNDLGLLLCGWPGRESEGEAQLAEAGQGGQARSWFNLGQYLWEIPDRKPDAIGPLRLAANSGYLRAHGTLAYRLEDLNRLDEALAAFQDGVKAGDRALEPHLADFLKRHPELAAQNSNL